MYELGAACEAGGDALRRGGGTGSQGKREEKGRRGRDKTRARREHGSRYVYVTPDWRKGSGVEGGEPVLYKQKYQNTGAGGHGREVSWTTNGERGQFIRTEMANYYFEATRVVDDTKGRETRTIGTGGMDYSLTDTIVR
ncbi:hypothetical protein GSI_05151 [Ganoderma sinense ZZ0214-1]|uniref:Uncharacterized protein n=1 Tax=Ganoderma sinense ZZ0214-1 TaxID=1077348 RepID=A0A2G8SFA9_9APHY|nr:hypothetical protein GSI_05151 [Ganoderma sinense ZZ0214-1]